MFGTIGVVVMMAHEEQKRFERSLIGLPETEQQRRREHRQLCAAQASRRIEEPQETGMGAGTAFVIGALAGSIFGGD